MPRPAKSQWDFGELFPQEPLRKVWTVSELTRRVRLLLEQQLGSVWIEGEVTNCRIQSSGHIYFSLKDIATQITCVLFRGELQVNRELVRDGQKLIVQGDFTVYEPRGQYQIVVRSIEQQGLGALQEAFQKLKQKLQAEGLFDSIRKRPLPRYPEQIGLVSSPTGAALQDIIHVVKRRQPGLGIILAPCRVQGTGAAQEIADAIRLLNQWSSAQAPQRRLSLILVSRGGGSLEDLWAFNEEVVARAIVASEMPVVSAVGHEIDFTICDFAADLRAATPSVAAELITEGVFSASQSVKEAEHLLSTRIRRRLELEMRHLRLNAQRLVRCHPRRLLQDQMQRLDGADEAIHAVMWRRWRNLQDRWLTMRSRYLRVRLSHRLVLRQQKFAQTQRRFKELLEWKMLKHRQDLDKARARLRLLSPLHILTRGYSITFDAQTGDILRSSKNTCSGQILKTRLADGEVISIIQS